MGMSATIAMAVVLRSTREQGNKSLAKMKRSRLGTMPFNEAVSRIRFRESSDSVAQLSELLAISQIDSLLH